MIMYPPVIEATDKIKKSSTKRALCRNEHKRERTVGTISGHAYNGWWLSYRGRVSQRAIKAISDNSAGGWGRGNGHSPAAAWAAGRREPRAGARRLTHVQKITEFLISVQKIKT